MNENLNNETYNNIGTQCRHYALKNHSMNDALFKEIFNHIILNVRKTSKTKTENITEYPNVSVVTLVHNRKSFFNLSVYILSGDVNFLEISFANLIGLIGTFFNLELWIFNFLFINFYCSLLDEPHGFGSTL